MIQSLLRALLRLLTHTVYRVRVLGLENVPRRGGALLVCNRLSYLDWLLLFAAAPRPVRFVLADVFANSWLARRLARRARVIPVDGSAGPEEVARALDAAGDALAAGELVCLIAEGLVSRAGTALPFPQAFQRVLARQPAPVVPVCLDQAWGSLFGYADGRFRGRWPWPVPYPVGVAFGAPLPATASAAEARLAVEALSADLGVRHADLNLPVHRQFVRAAARYPFRSCVFDQVRPEGLSYGRALAGVLCFVHWLRPRLGPAEMVGVWLPPGVGGLVGNVALAVLGKTSVNLNYTAGAEAVQSALRQCGVKHVLSARRFTARLPLDPGPGVDVIYLEDVATQISNVRRLLAFLLVILLPGWVIERWVLRLGRQTMDDLATVIFSSGSTGDPKGVMLTHRNIATNALACIQYLDIHKDDRVLGILPFFHSFGYTVTMWTPLLVGASTVYFPDPRAAQEIGELCKTYRCTIFLTTPTFLRFCLRRCEPDDFRSLHLLVCGAEKMPQALALEFQERFGVLPLEGYGCTELSPVVSANTPDRVVDGVRFVRNRPGSIGLPVPGVVVRVVNPDAYDEVLPPGQEGLLMVRGPNVMKGYLHKEELTRQVVHDGWYATGDMARLDEDGTIFLTGRLSRFAKVGGEMVPLEKVEEELHGLLGTAERVLAVTCVPDETRGERLVVLYTALEGQETRGLGRGLTARGLPNLWVPSERDYHRVDELPVLGSGKVDLKRLQETALRVAAAGRPCGPHREPASRPAPAAP